MFSKLLLLSLVLVITTLHIVDCGVDDFGIYSGALASTKSSNPNARSNTKDSSCAISVDSLGVGASLSGSQSRTKNNEDPNNCPSSSPEAGVKVGLQSDLGFDLKDGSKTVSTVKTDLGNETKSMHCKKNDYGNRYGDGCDNGSNNTFALNSDSGPEFYRFIIQIFLIIVLVTFISAEFFIPNLRFIYHYIRLSDSSLPCHIIWGHLTFILPKLPTLSIDENVTVKFYSFIQKLGKSGNGLNIAWLGWSPTVVITRHHTVKGLLNRQNLSKPWYYQFLDDGLITSKPEKWRVRRKLIAPFFGTKRLKKSMETMNIESKKVTDEIHKKVHLDLDISELLSPSIYYTINKSVWSMREEDFYGRKFSQEIWLIEKGANLVMQRILNPLFWPDLILKYILGKKDESHGLIRDQMVNAYADQIFSQKIESDESNKDENLLNMLEKSIDRPGTIEEGMSMIVAGYETTKTAIQWTLFSLGNNPEIQEILYQEIISIFPDVDAGIDDEKMKKCTYLDQCIKETLRLYPPIPVFSRCLDEDTDAGGKRILKGTNVIFATFVIHRNPEVYVKPDEYDPNRWSPENCSIIPECAFIPFGYGPRNCIGYRYALNTIKICLIHILRRFTVKSKLKPHEIELRLEISLKSTETLLMEFSSR